MRLTDGNFVQNQNSVRERHTELGRRRDARHGERRHPRSARGCLPVSLGSADGLFGSYRPTLEALIAAIPSRRVDMRLRSFASPTRRSTAKDRDFNEVAALSTVVPYCDIVVNERSYRGLTLVGPGCDAQPTNRAAPPC
jgi:hypothetical protein